MRQQTGLTLVELMISMVLGLVLTAGVMTLFVQSQQSYAATREIAIMDQNAQILMDLVEADLQRVGYAFGCRPDKAANMVNITQVNESGGVALPSIVDDTKLEGFSKTATNAVDSAALIGISLDTYNSIKIGSDYFILLVGDPEKQGRVQTRTTGSGGGANFKAMFEQEMPNLRGQVIYMATPDCDQVSQFTQVNDTPVGAREITNITHSQGAGTGTLVKNCENQIVGDYPSCDNPGTLGSEDFPAGGTIMVVEFLGYALNNNDQLIRINALATDGSHASALLDGVTEFKLEYGLATSSSPMQNGVRSVNVYATAQEINADASLEWADLVSLRLDFTLQSDLVVNGQPFEKRYSRLMTLRNEVIN
ncbi:PilW family protein [Salinibius halmophilus]|uniref:PilW family protein n=1 Tax=Salinibius halmophilus TaxID=1853216 RepID=UPI000E672210|nr:PilW family protein [Salinibius halmophilus]